ncbi:MAG: Alpha-D-glucose 1-phosphate phosphatase YihX [Chlamydiae bacterium]|nr:Alpha-D-glucose 1-phosphate phosphatase YihX [Chlamydiota bacterium]
MRLCILFILICSCLVGSPPKVVVFDYGGVIAKVDRRPMLEFLSEHLGLSYKKVKKDFASDKLYQSLEKPLAFWEEYSKESLPSDWLEQLDHQKDLIVKEVPGMRELIEKLKSQDIQVVLLSNTKFHRARFIERHGGYDLFDPILLSCHLGMKKPDPKIYSTLLRTIGHPAEECLFIDNRKRNVSAGEDSGIDSIVFESLKQLIEELEKREIALDDYS